MSEPVRRIGGALALLAALALPLLLDDFWLQTGLFVMAAVVGAIGLTLLVGRAGQLSLGHAFFAALGAYTYAWTAGESGGRAAGLGLPPVLALVLAGLAAAVAGALFSPISGRLRGIYLGLATIGLVFLARHLMVNAETITGGFNGRAVESFAVPGFSFSNSDPDYLAVAGVELGGLHRLWYLFLAVALLAAWIATNLVRSRTGRALANVRDSEVAAAAMGINVARAKVTAFVVSSAYAGIAGALMALAYGRIAPDVFGLQLSIDFLVMIVLGGLGSIGGAAVGAVFVVSLPLVLTQYSSDLPFLAAPGSGGLDAATVSRLLYGAAIIAVLLFLRGGLAGAFDRLAFRSAAAPDPSGLPPAPAPRTGAETTPTVPSPGVPTRSKETTP
ncbi:branched-chain amino acid ABC transporter permease [Blastococcus xanthinilyticus]|uniref:Amino acid/amide ABC transporter membrane protein 2 (HAAT family) n=1 Tax=Blastococcus xanthinilyticus TaxID=1564164 RepID=A0A5S5D6B4_9ACTN|nr:branched-chain amino acid ABC transporter permease [Blastococcus xanthinilyticus]TYP90322.1 amino acid/amide ABC transporter membrane protein 2 (HAAT family) [Blastococcus xanthinilyticus]